MTLRNYTIQVNGRIYTAIVEAINKDMLRVTVNGQVFESESITDKEVSTWVVRSGNDEVRAYARVLQHDKVDVWAGGVPFSTLVQPAMAASRLLSMEKASGDTYGGEIRALMPGRVTSILVKDGESIEIGTPLLTLEAMKMQNEITSPLAGRVKRVQVSEGETVKKDTILVVVE